MIKEYPAKHAEYSVILQEKERQRITDHYKEYSVSIEVTRILVWDLIDELRQDKELTVLLTTHYMEEASEADYVVIIDSGKVVASNTPVKLKNTYANDFIKLYEYDERIIESLKESKLKYNILENYIEVQFKNIEKAKQFIIKNEALIKDFEVVKGKMDNVFLNVTGKILKEF